MIRVVWLRFVKGFRDGYLEARERGCLERWNAPSERTESVEARAVAALCAARSRYGFDSPQAGKES